MLGADVFLAWGLSEIDDLVQFERRRAGKAYCSGTEAVALEKQMNWCCFQQDGCFNV